MIGEILKTSALWPFSFIGEDKKMIGSYKGRMVPKAIIFVKRNYVADYPDCAKKHDF